MNPLVRAELLKLRTTRTIVLLALAGLGLGALLGFATAATAGVDGSAPLGSAAMLDNVVGVSTIPAVMALLMGVLLAAGEHQHGTITTTFLVTPRRHLVVLAKGIAGALTGAVVTAGMIGAAFAGAAPRMLGEGVHVDLGWSAGRTAGGLLLAAVLLGVGGVLVGLLVRSQVAAVVGVLLWATVLEGILVVLTGDGLQRWLPGGSASTLAGGGGGAGLGTATAVLVTWIAAAAAVTVPAVTRRDVS